MKQLRIILAATAAMTALAIAAPSLAHPEHSTKQEVREIKIIKSADGKEVTETNFAADCSRGRKFESSDTAAPDAKQKRVSKMVICSDPGESDEAWAKTLREALATIEANDDMPADGKAKIIADLRSEIAKTGK